MVGEDMDNRTMNGYAMALVGFAMLLYNAYGYLSGQHDGAPAFSIMGLVFVAVGMGIAKKAKG